MEEFRTPTEAEQADDLAGALWRMENEARRRRDPGAVAAPGSTDEMD
jgi:hypothetical protein